MSTSQPAPDVSVILCVKNGGDLLRVQLDALARQQTDLAWELVLVDNGTTDLSIASAKKWLANATITGRLLDCSDRVGVAAARNAGVREAKGDLLIFCDADDEADEHWLDCMARGLKDFDLIGGLLEQSRINPRWVLEVRGGWPRDNPTPHGTGLDYVIGASMGLRRSAFERVGGFDERFTSSGEEVDLSWRVQLAGLTLGTATGAVMHYRLRDERAALVKQQRGYGRSEAMLRRKHRDLWGPMDLRAEVTSFLRDATLALKHRRAPRGLAHRLNAANKGQMLATSLKLMATDGDHRGPH